MLHLALGRPLSGTPSWAGGELTTLLIGTLRGVVRVTDSVLCTEPHEAWILLPGCDFDGAAGAADRAAAALEDLEPAVGIAIFPDHSAQPSWLARHAELASTRARNAGAAFAFADPQENDPPGASVIHELPAALRDHRLVAHYQPQLDLATRRTVGVEVLARWDHAERGLLEPAAFLPLAQLTRLGTDVDLEILRIAIRQAAEWARAGQRVPVAVKVCGRTLMTPGFTAELRGIMRRAGLEAELLKIEIPEEVATADARAAAVLDELHHFGVRICLERFGSGAASLTAVERLQVDELKLDPDLVHLARDSRHVGALASLVAGGHTLGLKVSVPHLDTEQIVRATWGLGCDFGQGFALGRPVPAGELADLDGVQAPERPAAAAAAGAKVLRLQRPRIAASSTLMRLGSAAALVAAGILAGSVPLGNTTLGGVVAGYVTAPATAILGSHPAGAPAGATGSSRQRSGSSTQTSGGSGTSTGSHSTSGTGSATGSTGSSSSSTSTGGNSTVPLPVPSVNLPLPTPTPLVPLPTPSLLP